MKKLLLGLTLLASLSSFASNRAEVLNGSTISYKSCGSPSKGNILYGSVITNIQSSDVFFRIIAKGIKRIKVTPRVIITDTDNKGVAHSNPVDFGSDCRLVQRCVQGFESEEVRVTSSCESGVLRVQFQKN